jgi:hypothetical protein
LTGQYDLFHNPLTELTTSVSVYGDIVTFGTGTLTAGNLYYYSSTGAWVLTDADSVTSSNGLLGVALSTSPSSGMLLRGYARNSSWSFATASVLFLSTNAGEVTSTAPSGPGDIVRIIGYQLGTGVIHFNPSQDWIEL